MRYNLVLKLRVCLKHYEVHQSLYFKNLKFLRENFLESKISLDRGFMYQLIRANFEWLMRRLDRADFFFILRRMYS